MLEEKARRDYTIAGKPFYQTELVMGQTRWIDQIERQARKAGYKMDDPADESFGEFIVDHGVKLLACTLIPGDQTQEQKVRSGLSGVNELEAWLDSHIDPTDVSKIIADFFVFSLRSKHKHLRGVPMPEIDLDSLAQAETQGIG